MQKKKRYHGSVSWHLGGVVATAQSLTCWVTLVKSHLCLTFSTSEMKILMLTVLGRAQMQEGKG